MTHSFNKKSEISNLHDVIDIANDLCENYNPEIWYRGQAKFDWKLIPGAYRDGRNHNYEKNISPRFVLRAPTRFKNCPHKGEWPEWLFFMQHYRLPTRLLDWTESILVATFFAVSEYPSEPANLWALNPFELNLAQLGIKGIPTPGNTNVSGLFLPPFKESAEEIDKIVAVLPREVDIRMMVQQSTFTVHGSTISLDDIRNWNNFLYKFEILPSVKDKLKKELFQLGIRESNLFPDIEHLSNELAKSSYNLP